MELSQKQALFMMNYAQYATYKIRTYNNIAVLEDEYKNLKDNMNLEIIKDESSVQTINYLMNAIYEERKNNKNRDRLKASLEKKMNNAIYESLPQLAGVFIGAKTPVNMVYDAVRTAGMMYMNYKKYKSQLSNEYDEKMWEYQQLTEDELNYIYRLLNTYSHQLIQQYEISDEWRLNENELSKMFDFLKDEDSKRKFTNLKNLSTDRFYSHFPLYWYHLAQSAMEIGNEKEALEAYAKFEEENIPIFRYDTTAVDAYKGKISILLRDQDKNIDEIKTKLQFIETNKTSWNDYFFVALAYANIGDITNAKRVLERNINELAAAVDSDLMDKDSLMKIYTSNYELDGGKKIAKDDMNYSYYQSEVAKRPARAPYITQYDGLELSRNLLEKIGSQEIALESIQKQYKLNTVSFNEALYFFGRTSSKMVAANSASEIAKIKVSVNNPSEKTSVVTCQLPLQWMLCSDTQLKAVFRDPSNNTVEFLLELDETAMSEGKNNKLSECTLFYTTERIVTDWKKNELVFSEIVLCHPIYPITLKFNIDMNKDAKKIQANSFAFDNQEFEIEDTSSNTKKSIGSKLTAIGQSASSAMSKGKINNYYDELLEATGSSDKNVTSQDLNKLIQFHAIGAAASSAAAGLIPGAGGVAATACYAGFVWAMYGRLCKKLGIPFGKNLLKALASAVVTNIAAAAVTTLIATSVVSLIPGIGSVAASATDAALGYAVVYVSGIIFMKLLTKMMKNKKDLSNISEDELKHMAETTIKEVDVKSLLKEAKNEYKTAKDEKIEIDESDATEFEDDKE